MELSNTDIFYQQDLKGLYSLNIVLPDKSQSVPGAILINNERIFKIIEDPRPFSELSLEYPDYQWLDFSSFFISPGIIDINVCFNNDFSVGDDETVDFEESIVGESSASPTSLLPESYENYEMGTKAAISGGVTTVIESPSLFQKNFTCSDYAFMKASAQSKALYCDFGLIAPVNDQNLHELESLAELGIFGFKAYLIPPAFEVPFLSHEKIDKAFSIIEKLNKPILFHPEKANERYLYMSSPFRGENLATRKFKPEPTFSAYAAAFPDEIEASSSDLSPMSSANTTPMGLTPLSENRIRDERFLEKQIIHQSNNLESLIKAEIMTYSASGLTLFDPVSPIQNIPDIPQFTIKLEKSPAFPCSVPARALTFPGQNKRPPPISCSRPAPPKENTDYKVFLANCPPHWEVNGAQFIITEMKKHPNCKVHICNLSSANAVYVIKKHKKETPALQLTCETSGFYLYYSDVQIRPGDTRFKTNPPIREEKNRKLLVEILSLNGIDLVSSCHRSVNFSLKFLTQGDFKRALSGISSIGCSLQALWTVINSEPRTGACKLAALLSENPAKLIGCSEKGSIQIGKHADFVVWDPHAFAEIDSCGSRFKLSPFIGENLKGKVHCTFLRGKLVYSNGSFLPCGKVL